MNPVFFCAVAETDKIDVQSCVRWNFHLALNFIVSIHLFVRSSVALNINQSSNYFLTFPNERFSVSDLRLIWLFICIRT